MMRVHASGAASPWRCSGVEACQKSVTLDQERKRLRSSGGFFFQRRSSPILHGERWTQRVLH
jgi:hypothetical protein